MPPPISDESLDHMLANAGLTLDEAQKADLQTIHDNLAMMKARVRQKRGHMAEPAHGFAFTAEDL